MGEVDRAFFRFFGGIGLFILLLILLVIVAAMIDNHHDATLMKICVETAESGLRTTA